MPSYFTRNTSFGTVNKPVFSTCTHAHKSRTICCRLRLKCDGTRAETRFRLLAKRTSPFKSAGASVQSTTGSRSVRISGSNAGYTMFRGTVKSTGYPLHSPVSPSLPLPCAITFQLSCTMFQIRREFRHECILRPQDIFILAFFKIRLTNINPRLTQVNDIFTLFP